MEKLNEVISKNLIKYRTLTGLTQKEVAEKLNYSDKAISKWETGNGLPDISVLVQLSELYSITVNDFLDEKVLSEPKVDMTSKEMRKRRIGIMALSSVLALVVAAVVFFILFMIPSTMSISWLAFIYCIPVIGIIDLVFSCIWFKKTPRIVFSSIIIWGIVLVLNLTMMSAKPLMFLIVGAVVEALDVLWFLYMDRFLGKRRKENKTPDQK